MNDQQGNESRKLHKDFIKIRALIGYLGEKSQFNWWDTNFLSETGLQFLSINFPRSSFSAGVNSVTTAARRLHDERIGKGGVYHLFRLPSSVEETVHDELLQMDAAEIKGMISDKETALENIETMLSNRATVPEGPVQVGRLKNIMSNFAVSELAMHYYDAFKCGKQCFPYFTAD
jgi:hypothetical protein